MRFFSSQICEPREVVRLIFLVPSFCESLASVFATPCFNVISLDKSYVFVKNKNQKKICTTPKLQHNTLVEFSQK